MPPLACNDKVLPGPESGQAYCLVRSFEHTPDGPLRRDAIQGWLRATLADTLKIPHEELQLARTPTGKPWLPAHAWLHFNLSHSGTLAAVAMSSQYPVGVDIEHVTGNAEIKRRVAGRFFHPVERAWLEAQTDDHLLHFTTLWSLKEAWIKMSGAGLAQPLSSFYVLPGEEGRARICGREGAAIGVAHYQTLQDDRCYSLACVAGSALKNPPLRWRVIFQR